MNRSGSVRIFVAGVVMVASGVLPYLDVLPKVARRVEPTEIVTVAAGAIVGLLGLCAFVTVPVGTMLVVVATLMSGRDLIRRLRARREEPEAPTPREESAGPYRSRAAAAIEPTDLLPRSTRWLRGKLVLAGILFAAGGAMVVARVNLSATMSSHDGYAFVMGAPLLVFAAILGGSALFVRDV